MNKNTSYNEKDIVPIMEEVIKVEVAVSLE